MPVDVHGKGKVFLDKSGKTLAITMSNTPENILDIESLQAIISSLSSLEDNTDSIVITGSGIKSFSFGYDSSCKRIREREHVKGIYEMGFTISRMIAALDVPVFSIVNGYALGMGLEIALSCDMIISSRNSKFGMPDFNYGLPSMTGIMASAMDSYGKAAYNRLMSGEIFDADTALSLGLITKIIEGDNLLKNGMDFVRSLNLDLLSFYKRENMKFSQSINTDRLFLDFYDLEKIRLKELEAFRNTL